MKFSDIPQFTKSGSWECEYSIKSIIAQIDEWDKEFGVDLNPDFQRGNVWTEEQQVAYIEFLLKGGKTARVIYFNNPNWGRYEKGKDDMVCVDGLQRLTAIRRFINNEIKVFEHYFNEFEGNPRMMQGLKINVNDLQTREEVLQWYLDFNTGWIVHSKEEIDRVKKLLEEEKSKNK